jgi:cell division protein FtsW
MFLLDQIKNLFQDRSRLDEGSGFSLRGISETGSGLVANTKGDRVIWAMVVILTVASLLLVYSSTGSLAYRMSRSTESYMFKQLGLILGGWVLIYFFHRANYTFYSRVAVICFFISIPLLIYTLFFGVQLNEGSRWIRLPVLNMTFQTSDLAKLALFMFLSRMLSRKQAVIKSFTKGFLPIILPVVIVCMLIAPANLSTAMLIFGTSMILMFIGRVRVRHLMMVVGVAMIPLLFLISLAVTHYNKETHKSEKLPAVFDSGRIPTWVGRIQTFMYGEKEQDNEKMYQNNQANIAIANGGLLGRGPGNSVQRNFLPHCYSDFIYALIIEEYGLLGGAFMIFIYLLFLFRCIRLYRKCPFAFGAFLALALSFTLVIQAIVNMGVNVSLLPNTGVTLPLVSMGGSSFLFTCVAIGIILSVARNVENLEGDSMQKAVEAAETKPVHEQKNDDGNR